jgi:hypothetical protein
VDIGLKNLMRRDHLGDLTVDWTVILECTLVKHMNTLGSNWNGSRYVQVAEICNVDTSLSCCIGTANFLHI